MVPSQSDSDLRHWLLSTVGTASTVRSAQKAVERCVAAIITAEPCTTEDCRNRAERFVSCEGEGAYPYCGECSDTLVRGGETVHGAVPDAVVAERDRYREALQVARLALLDVKATRKTDAWGNAVTEATKALAVIDEVLA